MAEGSTAWWGCDWSTRALSVGAVSEHGEGPQKRLQRAVRTVTWPAQDSPARLAWAYDITVRIIADHVRSGTLPPPGLVIVEQPGGASINWPLYEMYGVVRAALHAALVAAKVPVCQQETMTPSQWKKKATGFGGHKKPQRGDTFEYGVLTWAKGRGYPGTDFNEADALGIAEAGRREYALEPR